MCVCGGMVFHTLPSRRCVTPITSWQLLRALHVDVLAHRAAVGVFATAQFRGSRFFLAHQRNRILRMGRIAEQVEDGGIARIPGFKFDILVSAADVKAVNIIQVECLSVHANGSRAADVERSHFAPLQEVLRAQF